MIAIFLGILFISTFSYFIGKKLLEHATFNRLNSIRSIKAGQIVQYLDMLRDQCLSTSESTMTFDALAELKNGFDQLHASPDELARYTEQLKQFYIGEFLPKLNQTASVPYTVQDYFPLDPQTIISQCWYLAENPQPISKKGDFARATKQHPYNIAHEKYHFIFKRYAQRVGIADLYLVDIATGHVVYSLSKEVDFGTNLMTGPFKDSALGKSFIEIQKTNDEDFVKIIDFQFYDPSYGTPVGFISTPIYNHGKKIGALIFKFPIDTVNQIMTYNKQWVEVGLGKTGESFLMGKDKYMRTIARQYLEEPTEYIKMLREHGYDTAILDKIQVYDTTVLLENIRIGTIKEALENKVNTIITEDINGQEIISTYAPIKIDGIEWYIFVEMNTEEAFAPIVTLLWQIIMLSIGVIFFSTILLCIYIWFLTKPFVSILNVLNNRAGAPQKISITGSIEFIQFAQAYNAIVDYIDTIVKKIRSWQEGIQKSAHDLQYYYRELQEVCTELQLCNTWSLQQNKKIVDLNENLSTINTYDEAHSIQNIHILNTINSGVINCEKTLEATKVVTIELEKVLFRIQEVVVSALQQEHNGNAYCIEVKALIQDVNRLLQSMGSTIDTIRNHYQEYIIMMATAEKKQHEKTVSLAELKTITEEYQKNDFEVAKKIDTALNIVKTFNTLYITYDDLGRQLTMLVQEFEI